MVSALRSGWTRAGGTLTDRRELGAPTAGRGGCIVIADPPCGGAKYTSCPSGVRYACAMQAMGVEKVGCPSLVEGDPNLCELEARHGNTNGREYSDYARSGPHNRNSTILRADTGSVIMDTVKKLMKVRCALVETQSVIRRPHLHGMSFRRAREPFPFY